MNRRKDPFSSMITKNYLETNNATMESVIASLADALKKYMDEDKVVTPMDINTLEETTGFDGMKSKESVLTFIV